MKEVLKDIDRWQKAGKRVALARVVGVEGSGPRDPGATMAVSEESEVAGSVSGGCVEGAVVTEALDVLATGQPKLCTFGYSDDEAFAVGLTCGGTVHVFVEPLQPDLTEHVRGDDPVAFATVVKGPNPGATLVAWPDGRHTGTTGDPDLDRVVARDALAELTSAFTVTRHYGLHGEAREEDVTVFIESFAPPPQMVIFGAVDFTAALARVAKVLGYRVTVCDARPVFATPARFPMADDIVVDWPDRHLAKVGSSLGPRDVVCVLTHDPKFDVPAIVAALQTNAGYIGAMGSRRTTEERNKRLLDAGVTEEELARVLAPIGLDIGARTPEETAVSILAEIIRFRADDTKGKRAPSLRDTEGPIHAGGDAPHAADRA
ncbi:MAG TPA: XdhC/CoxI family protein [Acidimicrobiales bacterium]|nr:XdhC/CoxI family protein [Acidimicrobiales bacterium]